MFTRGGILIRNPRLRFVEEPSELGGSGGQVEPAFPAETPVTEMTAEQQAAYWKHQSRKHEARNRQYGDITPEKLTQLQQEAEDLRKQNQTDAERAVEEAKEAGRAEVRAVLAAERVKTALDRALEGRVPNTSALLDLDRNQFINGDTANTEAITAWVAANSSETAEPQKRFPDLFQGQRERVDKSDRETGKAEAQKRFGTTT
ncbi:hypothetical protein [Plantibacter sp. YIM 135249]|uniref:hypothetical protein n=1 Tax=Plantibacter sp. YIM 135249 TaxID=3423918 RepID=UPI003D3597DA